MFRLFYWFSLLSLFWNWGLGMIFILFLTCVGYSLGYFSGIFCFFLNFRKWGCEVSDKVAGRGCLWPSRSIIYFQALWRPGKKIGDSLGNHGEISKIIGNRRNSIQVGRFVGIHQVIDSRSWQKNLVVMMVYAVFPHKVTLSLFFRSWSLPMGTIQIQ